MSFPVHIKVWLINFVLHFGFIGFSLLNFMKLVRLSLLGFALPRLENYVSIILIYLKTFWIYQKLNCYLNAPNWSFYMILKLTKEHILLVNCLTLWEDNTNIDYEDFSEILLPQIWILCLLISKKCQDDVKFYQSKFFFVLKNHLFRLFQNTKYYLLSINWR